ncbi:RagB/SusD family nutrient uptake outer membrane protein [Polaribacter litorisediminis]|uniref:RagB/SusD family nutrient uptake outer membrane protein n=1 Tax=Polaribacter litorisediminis TaxID=1908341 RepID=UPI001CBFA166|nr:RagB/SusD family nutrient uptake outer membrane protein [Polaribacter litorisediminis]UAM98726.1 RagB/SusD family nutrient uptake outer membrane protein [Polaribacter litorisediminis]
MKTIQYFKKPLITLLILIVFTSCTEDLDRFPTNALTNEKQFSTVDGYKQAMVSAYIQFAGANNFFYRDFFELQEVTTDEIVNTWGDHQETTLSWSSEHDQSTGVYQSGLYLITLCNNFIIESEASLVASRGFNQTEQQEVEIFKSEVRFIRAYAYWMLMDLFGNPTFATEETLRNGEVPGQIMRADLFNFIESELKEIEPLMMDARANEYGRADKAAVWSLLARLYINAETYTDSQKYSEAIAYSKKVIDAGYSLEQNHQWLMLGDNDQNTNEFIYTFNYDNEKVRTWGGTNTYSLGAAGVTASVNGMSSSWNLYRVTPSIPALFPTNDPSIDHRAVFWTENDESSRTLEIESLPNSLNGYSLYKYRNVHRDGSPISQENTFNNLSDIDFPVFRLAEMYLIYAEAVLRGGSGGDSASALAYINKIRGRAYDNNPSSSAGNITLNEMDLDFILDERARELMWEGFRRTDLIRYKRFTTSDYLWAWKGGVKSGAAVNAKFRLFPIPITDLLANPKLEQNPGY